MGERIAADIFVCGGGVAGLTAAAAFGARGADVVIADPSPPVTDAAAAGADLRSTAFLQPSVAVLQAAGLWSRLARHAAPLQIMRIVDAGGPEAQVRLSRDFDAADLSQDPFGWNLPNWLLRREMVARLGELPNVRFLSGVAVSDLLTRSAEARLRLSDGREALARLVIGADGRESLVRGKAGIGVRTIRYGQKALVFTVTHREPHRHISTEVHRMGGPFTLVPLPDRADGMGQSAVVWMERGPEATRLMALPVPAFETAMNQRSAGVLGALSLSSRRSLWPIISQLADRMSGERVALMAEAAHVVPPIGAQGLNMSLADLKALLEAAGGAAGGADPGDRAGLDRYHGQRHGEVTARVMGIDALNRASMAGEPFLRDLRAGALNAFYAVAPLRKTLMRAGLGLR